MRVIDRIHRDRLATLYTILAIASVVSGALAGAFARLAVGWIFPTAGLVGYAVLSARAMILWQGRRVLPRPPRPARIQSNGKVRVLTAGRPGIRSSTRP